MARTWLSFSRIAFVILCTLHLDIAAAETNSWQWENAKWGRRAPLTVAPGHHAGFTLLPPLQTGVLFTNVLSDARAAENQIRLNGSGVALGDVDGDGWCDIYLCGLENGNHLYRNLGNWHFQEVTEQAGVSCKGQFSTGAALVDVDGDGDLDLLVNGIGTGTRLFINDGRGQFTESRDSGLLQKYGATSLALADIDGDGDLDLYVANYRTETIRSTGMLLLKMGNRTMVRPEDRDRMEITPEGRVLEFGEPDVLYLNDGKGHFTPVSWTEGRFLDLEGRPLTRPPVDWGLTVVFRDLNGDGSPDLYVCNDFQSEDRIWLNNGHGFFRSAPPLTLRHTSGFSMCVDVADINRDGYFDLFVADMLNRDHAHRLMQLAQTAPYSPAVGIFEDRPQYDRNTLQLNQGDATFVDIAPYAGLAETEWNWAAAFLDVDLDGYEDLLCTTSHMFDTQDIDAQNFIRSKGPWPQERVAQKLLLLPRMTQAKQAFRNRGDLTFEDAGAAWGFNQVGVSQGMAFADLDNDGDLDVVVNNLNGAAGLYRNDTVAPRVMVRLLGIPPNTHGISAKVSLISECVASPTNRQRLRFEQSQEICAGGRYLSSDDAVRVFAADVQDALRKTSTPPGETHLVLAGSVQMRLEVRWPSGRKTTIEGVKPDSYYEITEEPSDQKVIPPTPAKVWFNDFTDRLQHVHHDDPFDDFERQPLLPRKLSQRGPGVAWFDFDGDGHEDLIIGGGRGGRMAVFRGDGHGNFSAVTNASLTGILARDQTGILGIAAPGSRHILTGASNYEDGQAAGALMRIYDLNTDKVDDSFPGQESSTGPIALADVDGDGRPDLFVGGRCLPAKWPKPAASLLFLQRGGRYELDATNSAVLANAGLVSGAIFADLNGDGWPDLILACEWGPVRVFLNQHGRLHEATTELGLDSYVGWWNGVAVGDFDGDGRLDIAASNWGLNGGSGGYSRPALVPNAAALNTPGMPLVFWGEFAGAVGMGIIEAEFDAAMGKIVPTRPKPALELGFPFVAEKFATYAAYNKAAVADILGDQFASASHLAAPWLASTVFLNRDGKFAPVVLPPEAQFSPAFGICAADFDGDGNEDLFMAQNFFEIQPDGVRCDAGRGVLLRGDGKGRFQVVPGELSGLKVYGEGRGAAIADFDEDGRPDLVVTQNGASTRLFHNIGARPGIRIRLSGPADNPDEIGAQIRLQFSARFGPVREVNAGSGYWSQNSAVQVLSSPESPDHLWVRWPGGKTNIFALPANCREALVSPEKVESLRLSSFHAESKTESDVGSRPPTTDEHLHVSR